MGNASSLLSFVLILLIGVAGTAQEEKSEPKPPAADQQPGQNKAGQRRSKKYPPEIDGAKVEVYKTIGDVKLKTWIFQPQTEGQNKPRPAVVFFFGGGWRGGTPNQFVPHFRHLANTCWAKATALAG